ncbi:hypothetical protein A2627_02330 [Candidatus Woesebacteria bacterium RIFCSPHIGHO2_01_FULL_39_28]|uniref:Polymerase nucleotidyl transferase domain-containing protein n=1 Tax=Candidatus Woesebacteria bacterium RIFCSPHIGHO2_01_FULL_39_28 TaxID=1802496 RepID=A0A1F7YFJ5_9BACT|nr:MAG: hypothetical protein A2627_02330 [Candidatus Woesebacteria bacterium RIFCSPHIGHO2_01_FULL_39_28]OGM58173.1 MAG: hypothetical protein A3A50_00210 [Candidatus Woesebacteria bacterium RIFCSPLOWO2_01_FULL_38_20]
MHKFKYLFSRVKLFLINVKDYLYSFSEPSDVKVTIEPFDPRLKAIGEEWLRKINLEIPGLKIFFVGSVALGVPGQRDIDFIAECNQADLQKYANQLKKIFGIPRNETPQFVEWNSERKDYKIEFFLSIPQSRIYKGYKDIFFALDSNKKFLDEYNDLKLSVDGMSLRNYERARKKFFNKVINEVYN